MKSVFAVCGDVSQTFATNQDGEGLLVVVDGDLFILSKGHNLDSKSNITERVEPVMRMVYIRNYLETKGERPKRVPEVKYQFRAEDEWKD